jgi:hypothetical protein
MRTKFLSEVDCTPISSIKGNSNYLCFTNISRRLILLFTYGLAQSNLMTLFQPEMLVYRHNIE